MISLLPVSVNPVIRATCLELQSMHRVAASAGSGCMRVHEVVLIIEFFFRIWMIIKKTTVIILVS